ncbi:MAG: FAD-dependent oxidoreductase [Clostridia bacterium]|nr:FAD-dependent oxidoreductase [Clostridia bacterium]
MNGKKLIIGLLVVVIVLLAGNLYFLIKGQNGFENNLPINNSGDVINSENNENSGDYKESGDAEFVESGEIAPSVIEKEEVEIIPEEVEMPINGEYDVIVFGAEPEGIVTAISAARNNLDVLLVEKRDGPGGLMTYAMLNTIDMNQNVYGELLSQGIFEEFYEKIGNNESFDVELAKDAFEDMLDDEENITVMYEVEEYTVGSTGTEIEYAMIDGEKYVAKAYIDCTQDADITVAAGAEYVVGWEDVNEKNRIMSATLVIHMDNVDWDKACETIRVEARPNTGYSDDSIWAFGNITETYVPKQTNMRLKALNIGKQNDGSVLINSLQIINANMLDEDAKERAYKKCVKEAEYVAEFLKANVPGFEKSKLVGVAPELYVRETRHIIGEYRLTVKDILESTTFTNTIGHACYPIDVQTTSIYDYGYIIGAPIQYSIPMGTIIPKGFTNLLTIGRSGSYTSIAAGSARVIPTGMTLGEAAGIIAAVSIEKNIDFQEILKNISTTKDIQKRMTMQGMYLNKESKPVVDVDGRYYDFIIEMCEKGILSLGYDNKFNPEETMSEREFIVFLQTYLKRSFIAEEYWKTEHINLLDASEEPITPNRAREIMADITTYNLTDDEIKGEIEEYINLVMPVGKENLTLVRVYEITTLLKDEIMKISK